MTSLQCIYHLVSKSLFTLAVSLVLFACSTEENLPGYPDSFGDADTSTEAATSPITEPAPAPVPTPEPTPSPEPPPSTGTNSPAVISGASTGSVTEDDDPDRDNLLEVSGKLSIFDSDAGESAFRTNARSGSYGTLNISAAGDWRYSASNGQTAIQSLPAGSSLTDTIRVSSIDGTTHNVVITINGADDATVIGGDSAGNLTEDIDPDGDGLLEVSGSLTISDPDAGEAVFIGAATQGLYGSFTVDAAGNWNYAADNSLASIQSLDTGITMTDTLTVSSITGATQDVVITIAGVDETGTPGDITVSWIAPVEREDSTPISMAEIAGYRVYYGTAEGDYTNQVEISDSSTMQVTLSDLAAGTYYIVVTTYDTDGRESVYSQMVTRTI